MPKLETDEEGAKPWPVWAYGLIDEHAREDMRRAVLLARYTGQRQADVVRMSPGDIEDGGIKLTQQIGVVGAAARRSEGRASKMERRSLCANAQGRAVHA